jgi:hypothetical protein
MIDAMLPLVLWDEKLCEEIMSGMLIQVKNKDDREVVDVEESKIGQGKGFFPKDKSDNRPYITLVMQLGLQTKASKSALPAHIPARSDKEQMPTKHVYKTPSKISVRERKPSRASSRHPRYAIHVTGCSGSVYNVVKNKDINMRSFSVVKTSWTNILDSILLLLRPYVGSSHFGLRVRTATIGLKTRN